MEYYKAFKLNYTSVAIRYIKTSKSISNQIKRISQQWVLDKKKYSVSNKKKKMNVYQCSMF